MFSSWVRALYLAERGLVDAGIKCLRIDGNTSIAERTQILRDFREKPEIIVLLISIGTGGVG